jgi:TolB-like protein/Tfp pilus assembly protein PilF
VSEAQGEVTRHLGKAMSEKRSFFSELKRRNVYKIAVTYAVVAWLLIQVSSILLPTFEVPGWVMKVVVVLILAGCPVALVIAWAFELTPEGIKRAEDVVPEERRAKSHAWVYVALVAGLFSLSLFFLGRYSALPLGPSIVAEKSLAVLPFENLSRDPENAYFADGIQDEILSTVAKIGNLKVISRTSTSKYKSRPESLRQVGSELGVASVLEGSVQKAGERVRVIVQLIDATSDAHLWSETYDRELKDIFSVQTDIAQRVASALRATLSPSDQESLGEAPTRDPAAFQLYLKAGYFRREAMSRNGDPTALLPQALELYGEAAAKDPSFALAWAQASYTHAWMHWFSVDDSPERVRLADEAAQRALSLNPHLAETQLAVGYAAYWGHRDYLGSIKYFEEAKRLSPNKSETLIAIASVQRRLGHWDVALAAFKEAESLDPRNNDVLSNSAYAHGTCRRYREALAAMDRSLTAQPDYWDALCGSSLIALASDGDVSKANAFLARIPVNVDPQGQVRYSRWRVALWSRDFARAIAVLDAAPDWIRTNPIHRPVSTAVLRGVALEAAGQNEAARREFEAGVRLLEAKINANEGEPSIYVALGRAYAGLERKDDAVRAGTKAIDLLPITTDAFDGPIYLAQFAEIQARVGNVGEAIKTLRQLLGAPAGLLISPALLRLDPAWDPIRNDPGFQQLLTMKEFAGP